MKKHSKSATPNSKHMRVVDLPWRDYIEAYVKDGLSAEFLDAMIRLVAVMTRRKPPFSYSPIYMWDKANIPTRPVEYLWEKSTDAHKTIVVDLLKVQIKKGHLEELYYANKLSRQIYAHLKQAVEWHLSGVADDHGARRLALYERINLVLKQNTLFQEYAAVGGWGLAAWKGHEWDFVSEERLRDRVELISVPCPCNSRRKGRVLPSKTELATFVSAFLSKLGYPLPLNKLEEAASVHFDLYNPSEQSWPKRRDEATGETEQDVEFADQRSDFEEAETREVIEKFLGKMKARDLLLIREFFLDCKKLREAVRPGYSKSSAGNDLRRLKALLNTLQLNYGAIPIIETVFKQTLERMAPRNESSDAEKSISTRPSREKTATGPQKKTGKCK
jgi:hypothetical protein